MRASARAFIVDPQVMAPAPAAGVRRVAAKQDRFAADTLVNAASAVVRDVSRMQARASEQALVKEGLERLHGGPPPPARQEESPMTTPQPTQHPSRVVVDVTIAAPIERVWQALRDPALLAQWFGWDYDKLADEIDGYFLGGAVEVEPGRRLDLGGASSRSRLHAGGGQW